MGEFDFSNFIERIKDKGLVDIINDAQDESVRAESISTGVRGSKQNIKNGSLDYAAKLKKLIFFLENQSSLPSNFFTENDYAVKAGGKIVAQKLVDKGQMEALVLNTF